MVKHEPRDRRDTIHSKFSILSSWLVARGSLSPLTQDSLRDCRGPDRCALGPLVPFSLRSSLTRPLRGAYEIDSDGEGLED